MRSPSVKLTCLPQLLHFERVSTTKRAKEEKSQKKEPNIAKKNNTINKNSHILEVCLRFCVVFLSTTHYLFMLWDFSSLSTINLFSIFRLSLHLQAV
jgi:hypothetical protein